MRPALLAASCRFGWSQIWSHSPGFAGVRRDPSVTVSPGHGRRRTPVNAGQHCWKACWGQPLASSNLASSATLTCYDALGLRSHAVPCPTARVSFSVSVWVLAICLIPDKSVWWCAEMTHVVPGQGCRGRTSMEPRTPLKRAHRRSRRPGPSADLGAGCCCMGPGRPAPFRFSDGASTIGVSGRRRGPGAGSAEGATGIGRAGWRAG